MGPWGLRINRGGRTSGGWASLWLADDARQRKPYLLAPPGRGRPSPPGRAGGWTPPVTCSSSTDMRSRRSRTSPAAPGSPWTRSTTRRSAANLPCCAKSWETAILRSDQAVPRRAAADYVGAGPGPPKGARKEDRGVRRGPGRHPAPPSPRCTWPCATAAATRPRLSAATLARDQRAACPQHARLRRRPSAPPVSCATDLSDDAIRGTSSGA